MDSSHDEQSVYVVDDDVNVRDSMCMLLESVGLNASSYASARQFLDQYDGGNGALLLDVRMPGMSGLAMQDELHATRFAGLAVVFMTGHADVPMAVEALKKGAVDFLTKPIRDQDLVDCVQQVLADNRGRVQHRARIKVIEDRIASLTPREKQVMSLIAEGKPNKIVALDLDISQRTVEIHRAHIMKKMASKSLSQLVRWLDEVRFLGDENGKGLVHH